MSRYAERRAESVRSVDEGPVAQLRLAIHLGVPTGPDDDESRLLYELDALTGASQLFATLSASFFDRQAMLYERILERGADAGAFNLAAGAETARPRPGRARGRPRPAGGARLTPASTVRRPSESS